MQKQHQLQAKILEYWRAVELFSPQEAARLAPNDPKEPVFSAQANMPLPWSVQHPLKRKSLPKNVTWRHFVYGGIYNLDKMRLILEDKLGKDPESFDEPLARQSCLFAFAVSADGRPLFDTFIISTCAWASARTLEPGPESKEWLLGFDKISNKIAEDLAQRLAVLTEDEPGQELKRSGYNVGRPLNFTDIHNETQTIIKELGIESLFTDTDIEIRIKSTFIAERKNNSADDQDFLNSFFIADLANVAKAVRSRKYGKGLQTYLSNDVEVKNMSRINVRESYAHLFAQLQPEQFPLGCWPSRGHHPLVFSQQLAINAMLSELNDQPGLFAVNGPPGTGKTTLLRDLIASVVVKRATRLAALKHPSHAFAGEGRWKSGEFNRVISLWKEEFTGFEIVVASNNNGAVENVTLEIPGIGAIDESWLNHVDYFPKLASHLLEQPAWALIAARLGNKANRNDFLRNFWYGNQENVNKAENFIPNPGFRNMLQSYEGITIDWKSAVEEFNQAITAEKHLRQERQQYYQLMLDINQIMAVIPMLEQQERELQLHQQQLVGELQNSIIEQQNINAQLEQLRQHRLECRQFRPGLLEIIFSLGKAFNEWREKDSAWQQKIEACTELLLQAQQLVASKQQTLKLLEQELAQCGLTLHDKRQILKSKQQELIHARERLGQFLPAIAFAASDEDNRELSSPWSDPLWNEARVKVFLAALQLHKAFIMVNANQMRKSLQAAMDILAGTLPCNVPQATVAAAWTSLFFVIPVISTTFASVDRLFSHLNREGLGWLLIDEAGQAVPQAAVGAIWRAKRTIVVGDPLQLQPVVTIPFTAQQALRRYYKVDETWLPCKTSVQQLADRVNRWGTFINTEEELLWVGAPLRVHRRCDQPMFSISNQVAYDGLMVLGTSARKPLVLRASSWIHVESDYAQGHWIPAEGQAVEELLHELYAQGVNFNEIFLISPFRVVVRQLWLLTQRFAGLKVGTIHTMQGKETAIVILVLGSDPQKAGARHWASARPNLLNVAVSRAKRRLYIVGNRDLWQQQRYFSLVARILAE